MISVIIGLLLIVVLVLVIVRMVGGTKTTITYQVEGQQGSLPPLPDKSPEEIKADFAAMSSEWVEYAGATPPLKLRIRGLTHENLRRVSRKLIDELGGQRAIDQLPVDQATQLLFGMNSKLVAEAYVLEWDGALYPNGAPMPYSAANMATRLDADPYLMTFVTDHAHRLSPDWKDGVPPPVE